MFASILVAIDLDDPSSWAKALPVAVSLAQVQGAGLTIATVLTDTKARRAAQWSIVAYRELLAVAEARLDALARDCGHPAALRVGTGSIDSGIVDLARDVGADLIVLASHRPGAADYLIGANAVHVVRHAPCSVLVVRA